ncbi:MAG: hypothetical protein EXS03_06855 [Phycisphaerales bacterium]|nr:hypothetical protein [Phycisphaerales bacterium]
MTNKLRSAFSLLLAVACIGPASAAVADVSAPGFSFTLSTLGNTGSTNYASDFGTATQVPAYGWLFAGAMNNPGVGNLTWAYLVDPDPFITGNLSLTNTTGQTQDYIIDFMLNIDPVLGAGSHIAGQASGSLTDANGSGAALLTSILGGPVYTALGDGNTIQGLMSGASQSVSSSFGTASFSGGSFGYPIGSLVGPAIQSTIGIRFAFSLSAGDSVSFSSIFVANPIPGPGALALVLGVGLAGSRRRRQ